MVRQKKSIGWAKYVYVCEWDMCWRIFFKTFPWWLKNVNGRSKNSPFFQKECHFEIWFPKERTITFSWSKLCKQTQKRPNFACGNSIFPKTRGNKNKPWTHSTPLNQKTFIFHNWKNYGSLTRVIRLKFAVNMADLTYLYWDTLYP